MYDVGTFVDRYQVERVIGNDAVAVVYLVRHTMLGSRHALKLLSRNSQAADKALQGARDQATLHHPHVVAITDILHVASRVGLVMELVDGGSLEAHVANGRPALDEAVHLFRGIVRGVRHAHEHHVLHGGLAMRRVLLDRTNGRLVPKVTGFGIEGAIAAGPDALDDVSRIAGLPPRLDTDSDLTQLGAMLYELLTGRRPSAGSHPDPRTLVPSIPEEIAQLANTLVHGSEGSFGSCQAILEQLDSFLDDRELAPTRPVSRRAAPSSFGAFVPETTGGEAQLVSSEGEDEDTEAATDPGASSGLSGVASVAMAGEGIGPLPPPMPIVDDEDDESSPVPIRAIPEDRSLPPDDSIPPIDGPTSRRPTRWLYVAVLVIAPALGLLAAYQMRAPVPPPEPSAVVVVPEAPVADAPPEVQPVEAEAEPVVEEAALVTEAPAPEPEAVVAVPAVVAPTPPPEPAEPTKVRAEPKPNGTIRLEGDASQIWIELAGGWVSPGGGVPAGTYRLKALFDGDEPVRAGSVTVKPGAETVLRCSAAESECR